MRSDGNDGRREFYIRHNDIMGERILDYMIMYSISHKICILIWNDMLTHILQVCFIGIAII